MFMLCNKFDIIEEELLLFCEQKYYCACLVLLDQCQGTLIMDFVTFYLFFKLMEPTAPKTNSKLTTMPRINPFKRAIAVS